MVVMMMTTMYLHFQAVKFGPRKEEVARGWRRLHNEELRNLDASPNIVRVIK
jgi:hypothetical protein